MVNTRPIKEAIQKFGIKHTLFRGVEYLLLQTSITARACWWLAPRYLTKNHALMLRGYQRLLEKHGHRLSDSYLSLLHRQMAIRYGEIGNVAAARKHLKTASQYNVFDKANLFYRVCLLFGKTGFRIARTIHTQIYDRLLFR